MDKLSLAALLEEDREMVVANLNRDRSLAAAQSALEKAVDRVMYRYTENAESEALRDSAQHILQAMKNALPMIDTVGEARAWKKEVAKPAKQELHMGLWATLTLLLGLVLVVASVVAVLLGGNLGGALAFVKALLPVGLGCAALFLAGTMAARPKKGKAKDTPDEDVRTEFLVDAEKAWHVLHGAMLLADGQLDRIREEQALQAQERATAHPAGAVDGDALELFAELLESAYASKDESARESASAIRFYLHNAQIDAVDYAKGREAWFEFLPADRPGTLRPALVYEGRLLKKGMAAR